jgi:hypothetical protein
MNMAFLVLVLIGVTTMPTFAMQGKVGSTPPPGWQETQDQTMAMVLAGKDAEVIAIYEQWIARHPSFADGYFRLGGAHESLGIKILAGEAPGGGQAAIKHLETAATHFARGLELKGSDAEFWDYRALVDVYGVVGLNRPEDYERFVRAGVTRFPAEPMAHSYLITLLATRNEPLGPAVRAARVSIRPGAEARADLAASLVYWVRDFGRLYGDTATTPVLREARSLVDEALALEPADDTAARTKALIETLQAGRQR